MNPVADLIDRLTNGKKSYVAAALAAVLAANEILNFVPENWVGALGWLAAALGIAGLKHAISKAGGS